MATINKHSLREEFDTLKVQFEQLSDEGKMGPESRTLFQALLMLFELLMAVFMEKNTAKDSKNSSKPSSQTPKDDTAVTRPGANGKGRSQNDVRSDNTRTIETIQVAQMISLKRVQHMVRTLIGQAISEATLLKYMMQLHRALADWEHAAIEQILTLPALHVDETSLRVDKRNHWIHVYSSGDVTLKFLHPKRGCEAIEAIGIIPRYGGVAIHDCWASYLAYDHCDHGLCGSHLLRELTFIVDTNGYAWAVNMKRLLQETCHRVSKRKRKKLTQGEYKNLQKRYRNLLTRGEKELPPIPPRQNGKRGRVAKSDAHNLWERLKKHETAVLLFAKHSYVAFTNNRAERDLRMSKVKQKVSGCFRTREYAEAYCRISSYLQTMANKGYNPLVAIQMALSGQLYADTGE
jgi:transposase